MFAMNRYRKCGSKDIAEAHDDSLSFLLVSRAVDDDDNFNTTNYENRAAVRSIDRVCIG